MNEKLGRRQELSALCNFKTTTELITSIHLSGSSNSALYNFALLSTVPGVSDFASLAVSVSFASFEMSQTH